MKSKIKKALIAIWAVISVPSILFTGFFWWLIVDDYLYARSQAREMEKRRNG